MTKAAILELLNKYATVPNQSRTKTFIPPDCFEELAGKIIALKREKKPRNEFIPPSKEEVSQFFFENGYDPNQGIEAWKYYSDMNPPWTDSEGKPVRSWKSKCRVVWFKPQHKVDVNISSKDQKNNMVY
jgi:hypothetical protein